MMKNKVVVVTGANSGIGKATAIGLAQQGARIIMICRSKERGEAARQEIIHESGCQDVHLELCDLSLMEEVHQFAPIFRQKYPVIDVLVNNAGAIFGSRRETKEGLEQTFALNHIGYFLLTHYLLENVRKSDLKRIVNVSSMAHGFINKVPWGDLQYKQLKYKQMPVYSLSKLFNIYFTKHLAAQEKEAETNVTVNCLHPGVIGSNFGASGSGLFSFLTRIGRPFLSSNEKGAETSIFLASSPKVAGVTGKYFTKCKEKRPSKLAQDQENIERLWQLSMEICNLEDYGVPVV